MDGPSAVEFLQSALQSAELYSGALRDCIAKCAAGASSSEVQSVLHEEGSQAIEFLQAQMQGWQGLLVCFTHPCHVVTGVWEHLLSLCNFCRVTICQQRPWRQALSTPLP